MDLTLQDDSHSKCQSVSGPAPPPPRSVRLSSWKGQSQLQVLDPTRPHPVPAVAEPAPADAPHLAGRAVGALDIGHLPPEDHDVPLPLADSSLRIARPRGLWAVAT